MTSYCHCQIVPVCLAFLNVFIFNTSHEIFSLKNQYNQPWLPIKCARIPLTSPSQQPHAHSSLLLPCNLELNCQRWSNKVITKNQSDQRNVHQESQAGQLRHHNVFQGLENKEATNSVHDKKTPKW